MARLLCPSSAYAGTYRIPWMPAFSFHLVQSSNVRVFTNIVCPVKYTQGGGRRCQFHAGPIGSDRDRFRGAPAQLRRYLSNCMERMVVGQFEFSAAFARAPNVFHDVAPLRGMVLLECTKWKEGVK